MLSHREFLKKLLRSTQVLLADAESLAQTSQLEPVQDRESRRYVRVVRGNVNRIHRMLSDAESFWTFGGHQLS